jgi:hypothetical protein
VTFHSGDLVCVHGDVSAASCWIGEVDVVIARNDGAMHYVKRLGYPSSMSLPFHNEELRETVMTFEGPMCTVCRVSY